MSLIVPVGIDLGTSFCAVSYVDADGSTRMIPNEVGELLTPSVVYFENDQVTIGRCAAEAALVTPDRVAENAKRDMGSASYRCEIDGHEYPPEVIQSCILRRLRHDVIAAVGEDFQAVITVPAYFDEVRRKATHDAAIMSGLPVLDIVNEPMAAALSFGERLGYLTPEGTPSGTLHVLVYDLGGGTFDVTVIRLAKGEVRTLATDGDYELGGVNWDQRLAELAESQYRKLWPDAAPFQRIDHLRLSAAARAEKHALTDQPVAVLDFTHDGNQLKLPVAREDFQDLTADLLERTVFTTKQALQASGLIWNQIDRVLLVGGSSRMPAVRRMLKELSGIEPDETVNPDEAVSRGAAIFARNLLGAKGYDALAPKLRITDVNAHSLGIEGVDLNTLIAENVKLIPRNSPLPCVVRRTFVTRVDDQPSVKVQLLEGESSVLGQCSHLASATIRNLPPGLPKGTPIDVRYELQANGRLKVSAAVQQHGADAEIELQRVRGLADKRVQRWKRIVCRDGGYRDFQDAIVALMHTEAQDVDDDANCEGAAGASSRSVKSAFIPAVEFGAPRAAADTLHAQFRPRPQSSPTPTPIQIDDSPPLTNYARPVRWPYRKRKEMSIAGYLVGHVIAASVGLGIGYYILCWIRPDLNFLQLALPGIPLN